MTANIMEARAKVYALESKYAAAEDAADELRTALLEATEELKQLEARIPEPANGSTIRFNLMSERGNTHLKYAAIRVEDRWYTTGATCPRGGYSWAHLIEWINTRPHSPIRLVDEAP